MENTATKKPRAPRKTETEPTTKIKLIDLEKMQATLERLERETELYMHEAEKLSEALRFKHTQVDVLTELIRDLVIKNDVTNRDIFRALDGIGVSVGRKDK